MIPIPRDCLINDVYYVVAEKKLKLNPIAIRPQIYPSDPDILTWEDTERGEKIHITHIETPFHNESAHNVKYLTTTSSTSKPISYSPNKIIAYTDDGSTIELHKLTLEIFNKKIRPHVAGNLKCNTDAELREYYLKENFH